MSDRVIRTLVKREDDGTVRVLSPDVGWWSGSPAPGQPLGPRGSAGVLTQLRQRFALELPMDVQGRVVEVSQDQLSRPVEYGQTLFVLTEAGAPAAGASSAVPSVGQHASEESPAQGLVVEAPTDGIFYPRPSPGAPPYVEAGHTVRRGQTVGLVEVMKTFNQIAFDGPGFPEQAVVREVRCAEGEEVRAGQVLIVLGT